MSVNCVDVVIDLANKFETDLMLIASRRQIETGTLGNGYVNNWSTEEFAHYVLDGDKKGRVILARDHGGPWQGSLDLEEELGIRNAMASAKASFEADIQSGFQVVHIDPSVDIHSEPSVDEILDRVFELYEYCWMCAQRLGNEILFEIGTEEQTSSTNSQEELEYVLTSVRDFCKKNALPMPFFVVAQIGTKVVELKNVGSLDSPVRTSDDIPAEIQVPKIIEICNRNDIFLKAHNTDYLSPETLRWYPRLGVHAANVAPEFGVVETRAFVATLKQYKLDQLLNEFLELSFNSRKWEKWLVKDSVATDIEKSIMAGHYIYATDEFKAIKDQAEYELQKLKVDLTGILKNAISKSILNYMGWFRLVRGCR